jgi:hypothetical protein
MSTLMDSKATMGRIRIADQTGDTPLFWSRADATSVALAEDVIAKAMQGGSGVFTGSGEGQVMEPVTRLDQVQQETVIMKPIVSG